MGQGVEDGMGAHTRDTGRIVFVINVFKLFKDRAGGCVSCCRNWDSLHMKTASNSKTRARKTRTGTGHGRCKPVKEM